MLRNTSRLVASITALLLIGIGGFAGYEILRSHLSAEVYRDRLETLHGDYEVLREEFNQAIARTAVTELLVEGGQLSVLIRTADGHTQRIPTELDPSGQVYVEYLVKDGRLWIRRVFDESTPPYAGVTIDPKLADIDWDNEPETYGKAVCRRLTDGRWVITTSGDGSLAIAKADPAEPPAVLEIAPKLGEYRPVTREADTAVDAISFWDVLKAARGSEPKVKQPAPTEPDAPKSQP